MVEHGTKDVLPLLPCPLFLLSDTGTVRLWHGVDDVRVCELLRDVLVNPGSRTAHWFGLIRFEDGRFFAVF